PHAWVRPDRDPAGYGNSSSTLGPPRRLFDDIDALALQCVEQPCAPDALDDHTRLVEQVSTPICLDETITSVGMVHDAVARHACDAIAVKVGRLGLRDAKRVHDDCVELGIDAVP